MRLRIWTRPETPETPKTPGNPGNGLTGQTVLLNTDDVELYISHVQYYVDKFKPANQDERIRV